MHMVIDRTMSNRQRVIGEESYNNRAGGIRYVAGNRTYFVGNIIIDSTGVCRQV